MNTQQLQEARCKDFNDFYNNKLPKHVPLSMILPFHLIAQYGEQNLFDFQYDYSKLREPVLELADKIYTDGCISFPVTQNNARPPMMYQLLGSQSFVMGKNGYVQHPEVSGMHEDEYGELIADPFTFLMDKVIPRQYKNLDFKNEPVKAMRSFITAMWSLDDDMMSSMPWFMELIEKKGYYPGAPLGSATFTLAPFDFIADQLRSFSGISMDIRRHRSELKEAAEAVMPLMFYWGLPENPHPEGFVLNPLHMPTFMREKDFAELWFPTYKTMLEQFAAKNARTMVFCENDWMRYLDYLQELPAGTLLMFEYGDPKAIKDKLGDKFLIQGLYPISLIRQGTKQECIDKAKEILDTMMPGGGYIFGFDKNPLTLGDINLENYIAVAEFVHEYGVYDNPGEAFGTPLNSEGFVFDENIMKPLHTKYLLNWEGFKSENPLAPDIAKPRIEKYSARFFDKIMNLLV
ncbi:MAG: uroporphyrinogen decarboxylase family protein [Eubacterium sp.]|nr:uroporphyrinogen decarboxylase family protein [Eubacterium sp.]